MDKDKENKSPVKEEAKLIQIIVDKHGVRQQTFGYEDDDVADILQRTEAILLSGADNLLRLGIKKDEILKSFDHILDVLMETQDYKDIELEENDEESKGDKNE